MAFNDIMNGDALDADKVMQNFRHGNYGSDLLPRNSDGSANTDTLNIGSTANRWKIIYADELNLSGGVTLSSPLLILTGGSKSVVAAPLAIDFNNTGIERQTGGTWFNSAVSTTKITPPAVGLYSVIIGFRRLDIQNSDTTVNLKRYNSSAVLQEDEYLYIFRTGVDDPPGDFNKIVHVDLYAYFYSGDYFQIEAQRILGGGTSVIQDVSVRTYQLFNA